MIPVVGFPFEWSIAGRPCRSQPGGCGDGVDWMSSWTIFGGWLSLVGCRQGPRQNVRNVEGAGAVIVLEVLLKFLPVLGKWRWCWQSCLGWWPRLRPSWGTCP